MKPDGAQVTRALIEGALSGDEEASRRLVRMIAPTIHVRVARAFLRRSGFAKGRDLRPLVEDAVQDVFVGLFANDGRSLRAWDPDRGLSFLSFVGFLAEREVGMAMRVARRNPFTEDPTADNTLVALGGDQRDATGQIESRDLLGRLAQELRARLSPKGRRYFELLYIDQRSVASVAEEMGTTPDALYAWRSRMGKLLKQLRDELCPDGAPDVR